MLTQAWKTLRKRPWWVLAGVVLGALAGLALIAHQVPVYVATARIIITRDSDFAHVRVNKVTALSGKSIRFGNDLVHMRNDAVLGDVVRDLNLLNDPAPRAARRAGVSQDSLERSLIRELRGGLSVRLIPETSIISIDFSSLDPNFAAAVTNKLVEDFTARTYRERVEAIERTSQWPSTQLAHLKDEVQTTQQQMIEVQRRLGNTGFASEYSRAEKSLDQLTRNALDARTRSSSLDAQYRGLLSMNPHDRAEALDSLPTQGDGDGLDAARLQLQFAQVEQNTLASTLGPRNPEAQARAAEVASLRQSLAAARARKLGVIRRDTLTSKANAAATEAELDRAFAETYGKGKDALLYRELLRQFTFTRFLYVTLSTRLRTAALEAGLSTEHIELLDAAEVPDRPLPENNILLELETTLLGLLIGSIVALAIENFRIGLRTLAEVESITDLPSLTTLPRLALASVAQLASKSTPRRNLVALDDPLSPFTDGLRILHTNLELSGAAHDPQYILFTSATPSEGKTTVAGNYAVVLAEQGARVLLIDADMHRPNIHHRFGLSGKIGLSTVLTGHSSLRQAVQTVPEAASLDILPSGPVPPSPYTLLSSPGMLALLQQAGPLYTHIIIDSPPVMAVSDGVLLSRWVDAVVYVVRQGKTGRRTVRQGRDLLASAGAPLAGVVLNGLSLADDERAA